MSPRKTITVLTPDGALVMVVPSRADRKRISAHLNAVRRYLETGDATGLRTFEGITVETLRRERIELVADMSTVERLVDGGDEPDD